MISFMTSALSQLGINMNSENAALPKLQLLLKNKTKQCIARRHWRAEPTQQN